MKLDFRFIIGFLLVQFLICALFFYVNINSDKKDNVRIEQIVETEDVGVNEDANKNEIQELKTKVHKLELDVESLKNKLSSLNSNIKTASEINSVSSSASSEGAAENSHEFRLASYM